MNTPTADIIFDSINDNTISIDPDVIFKGLQFKLKKFDFDKDIIFQNMTKMPKDKDKISFKLMIHYEFNFDNILEKLFELFPDKIVTISESMFVQLYLYLIKNNFEKRFKYSRELFESTTEAMYKTSLQCELDNLTHMLYMLYINNHVVNKLLSNVKCFYDHCNLIKTSTNKNGFICYTGLTPEGIKTMSVLEWAKYLKLACKDFFISKKRSNDIEYESDSRE